MHQSNITYRITALTLALLMFITSVGFAVDMHYCQGQLKSYSFFGKAKNCHELAAAKASCPFHAKMAIQEGCTMSMKDCCENKTHYFQLDQDQEIQNSEWAISPTTQVFLLAYSAIFITRTVIIPHIQHHFLYKPPLIRLNRSVLFQSFLL